MPRLITIVVPVLNEEDSIQLFFESMAGPLTDACARHADIAFEFLFVDDGSTDATVERLLGHPYPPAPVGIVSLSRHFGKEAALTAGLAEARGDAVIVIDVDLQDPPDLIPDMVARWRAGAPVVLAQRSKPRAVLVSVADWDATVAELQAIKQRLARLEGYIEAKRNLEQMQADPSSTTTLSTLCAKLGVAEKPAVI